MNRAQVLDAWRVHDQQRDAARRDLHASAVGWVSAHPELCDDHGKPCPFAVAAALHYRRLGGPFTADVVRRHRDLMVARMLGHANSNDAEGDA